MSSNSWPLSSDLSRKFANMGFFFAMVVVFIHMPHHPTAGVTVCGCCGDCMLSGDQM